MMEYKLSQKKEMVTCQEGDCKSRAYYGYEWKEPLYCGKHKDGKMENVVNQRCQEEDCKTLPIFGYEWKNPMFCAKHKDEKNGGCCESEM
jgi:hypothetical protein